MGLVTAGRPGQLQDYQAPYGRPSAESKDWKPAGLGAASLAEVVRRVKPTMLVAHTERSIIVAPF